MIFHLHRRWNNAAHTCYPGLFLWIVSNRRFEEFETIQSKSPHIRILNDRVLTSLLLSRGPSIHLLTNIQAMTAGTAKMQVIAISQPIPLAQPKQDQKSVFISKQTRRAHLDGGGSFFLSKSNNYYQLMPIITQNHKLHLDIWQISTISPGMAKSRGWFYHCLLFLSLILNF